MILRIPFLLALCLSVLIPQSSFAQEQIPCKINHELTATGMQYLSSGSELIYDNTQHSLYSQLKFDGDSYYLILIAKPYGHKELKAGSVSLLLKNRDTLTLDLFDVNYSQKDSSVDMLYRLKEAQIALLKEQNILQILGTITDTQKYFGLVKHQDVIRQQLICLLAEKN